MLHCFDVDHKQPAIYYTYIPLPRATHGACHDYGRTDDHECQQDMRPVQSQPRRILWLRRLRRRSHTQEVDVSVDDSGNEGVHVLPRCAWFSAFLFCRNPFVVPFQIYAIYHVWPFAVRFPFCLRELM